MKTTTFMLLNLVSSITFFAIGEMMNQFPGLALACTITAYFITISTFVVVIKRVREIEKNAKEIWK